MPFFRQNIPYRPNNTLKRFSLFVAIIAMDVPVFYFQEVIQRTYGKNLQTKEKNKIYYNNVCFKMEHLTFL